MNGLVRQYLPKGTDLSVYSQVVLEAIADDINNRPRKGLGVRSPLSVYRELLANSQQHSTFESALHTFSWLLVICAARGLACMRRNTRMSLFNTAAAC
jgi:hypothetical protein